MIPISGVNLQIFKRDFFAVLFAVTLLLPTLDIRHSEKWFVCQTVDRMGGTCSACQAPQSMPHFRAALFYYWGKCVAFFSPVMAVLLANANGILQGQVHRTAKTSEYWEPGTENWDQIACSETFPHYASERKTTCPSFLIFPSAKCRIKNLKCHRNSEWRYEQEGLPLTHSQGRRL